MKKSRLLAALVLTGLLGAGAVIYVARSREPIYDGKPMSHWIRGLASIEMTYNAASNKAFDAMGTNALPVLLNMLRTKDSKAKLWLRHLYYKQSLFHHHFTMAEEDRISAVLGFSQLGALARPAVPAMIGFLGDDEIAPD